MFKPRYRSAHEPEAVAVTDAVAALLGDRPTRQAGTFLGKETAGFDVPAWLRARDQRLQLEIEASHPLGYMAPWLPQVFPDARFLITLRDPGPWLKSRLNFHYYKSPPEWQRYRDLVWGRWHSGYHREEKLLEKMGLYSIDAYLGQYREQYQLLAQYLPRHRRLLLKTENLDTSAESIGAFLRIDPAHITREHANALQREESVIDLLPAEFVAERIEANCRWMKDFA